MSNRERSLLPHTGPLAVLAVFAGPSAALRGLCASAFAAFFLVAVMAGQVFPAEFGDAIHQKTCDPRKMGPALAVSPENEKNAPVLLHGTVVRFLEAGSSNYQLAVMKVDQVLRGEAPVNLVINIAGSCSLPLKVGQSGFVAGWVSASSLLQQPELVEHLPILILPKRSDRYFDDADAQGRR